MITHTPNESITQRTKSVAPLLVALLQRDTIRSLTLTEPWASLVALEEKRLETRSWAPWDGYRGPIAIHASSKFPVECEEQCYIEPFYSVLQSHGFEPHRQARRHRNAWQFPLGHVIAIACLENVYQVPVTKGEEMLFNEGISFAQQWQPPTEPELSFGNFAPGRYVWEFSMIHRLSQPLKASGALGLWNWLPPTSFWEEVQTCLDRERGEGKELL